MAITFEKQSFGGRFPEIWRGACKVLPGGFKPTQELPNGTVLRRATPIFVDFDARSAAICKTTSVLAGGTTTKPRVPKGHYFVKGDTVIKYGDASAALNAIKDIDTSNSAYDTLTLTSAITGLTTGDILVEGLESGADASKTVGVRYQPNMVVASDKLFDGKGLPTIDAAYEAVVLTPSLMFPILSEWKQGIALKDNPNIIFITQ